MIKYLEKKTFINGIRTTTLVENALNEGYHQKVKDLVLENHRWIIEDRVENFHLYTELEESMEPRKDLLNEKDNIYAIFHYTFGRTRNNSIFF